MSSELFELSLLDMNANSLERAAAFYARSGYLPLRDVEESVVPLFEKVLDDILTDLGFRLGEVLRGSIPLTAFSYEERKRLSQIDSSPQLQARALEILEPILLRLLGPLVHVSRDFHAQFKGGDLQAPTVGHGGYPTGTEYLEPFGQYLLHQDFTGASLPTSPSSITVWVPMTTGPHWGLRLYPGSHRRGILCNKWIPLDDERLQMLGEPVDFPATRGRALLFHGLLMHSTTNPGVSRRVSCDMRFFPLCGFLPTIPWLLGEDPPRFLQPIIGDEAILRAPRLETLVYLGQPPRLDGLSDHSVLNWVRYIERVVAEDRDGALEHLERFANAALTGEAVDVYRKKYHHHELRPETMARARQALAQPNSSHHPRAASDLGSIPSPIAL
jgi:hypothetical protein